LLSEWAKYDDNQICRGCNSDRLEVEQMPAPDADLLDLRRAVPQSMPVQFLDLEAEHIPVDSDDSSGQTNEDSDTDMSSFIDDTPIDLTLTEMHELQHLAHDAAKKLPITAALLRSLAQPIVAVTASAGAAASVAAVPKGDE
jgi:hypothetical protein